MHQLPIGVKKRNLNENALLLEINMTEMQGKRYEDTYGEYMKLFELVAQCPKNVQITIRRAPWSWVPLLLYMDCRVEDAVQFFDNCPAAKGALVSRYPDHLFSRTFLEVVCGFRPETVDALWKLDMQWPTERRPNENLKQFIVTNNGSFHRPEVLEFRQKLQDYRPDKRDVVLVPCAADKPYPSPMHEAVLKRLPSSFYLCNATGVLGLVPQDLWSEMPYYDSGIPNEWRLMETVMDYFTRNTHRNIVVYCDFYSKAIQRGLALALIELGIKTNNDKAELFTGQVIFINECRFYFDYIDLLHPDRLKKLEDALQRCVLENALPQRSVFQH